MASTLKVDEIKEKTVGSGITLGHALKNSSGTEIMSAAGVFSSNINGGTISNATLDSSVTFPAIGQLAFWHGFTTSSSVAFTLDGVSSYTVIFNGRHSSTPYFPKNLTFIIDSSTGTITSKTDNWGTELNESFDNSTKVLTLSMSSTQCMSILIFKGAVTEGT